MTTQSRVGISKETHHGRSEKNHRAEDCQDKLLRNLRLLILCLRMPGKRLSLRANQLPMWLPQANSGSVGRLCPARRTVAGGDTDEAGLLVRAGRAGIYRLTRNPMYLGFLWILPGWGIFLSNAPAFLVLPGFALSMNRFQIEPEERALTRLFGQAFVAYATQVRRWR